MTTDSKQLRTDYVAHVSKMLQLAGDSAEKSAAEAQTIMNIETAFAESVSHPRAIARSESQLPQTFRRRTETAHSRLSWDSFFTAVGLPAFRKPTSASPISSRR